MKVPTLGATTVPRAGYAARLVAWLRAPMRRTTAHNVRSLLARLYIPNVRFLLFQADVCKQLGWASAAKFCESRALRLKLVEPMSAGDLAGVLTVMAGLERNRHAAPVEAGRLIAEALITEAGRDRLLQSARSAREGNPDSAVLAHLVTLCQAKQGDYRAASDDLSQMLSLPYRADDPLERQRFGILRDTWRVVDQIAREQMDWAHDSEGYSGLLEQPEDDPVADRILGFKEHALQGRQREVYLAACEADLAQAKTLQERLKAISDMLRPSLRHIPSYTASHDRARGHLLAARPQWEPLLTQALQLETAEHIILDLCSLLKLARQLGLEELNVRCLDRLEALSEEGGFSAFLWPAAETVIARAGDSELASRIMARITTDHSPQTSRDVKNYFHWALVAGEYEAAHAAYKALPARLRAQPGLLQYVQILQRESRFTEAMALTREIHALALAFPARLNAFSNNSLIKRTGELAFLIETAEIYSRYQQPIAPKGVMLIAPRNVDQLRRYPLMVLAEMKREGWAVVPLVSGLLPIERTGDPAIDVLHGAISPNIRFSAAADAHLPVIEGFVPDIANGKLRWGAMDLSHPLWEEAAINRRRYTIDWSCPELQRYLGNLADWTAAMGRCLEHAAGLRQRQGTRFGAMSLFNARLPDCVFRFYCAAKGDPENFFFVHAANGYQNYFTNFTTNLSQRFVLRNMTKAPHARSASFPLPENFTRYCAAHMAEAPGILRRFEGVTAVTRSTEGRDSLPAEAQAVLDRVTAWKAKGGRVVCAFGKVVCDSGVPFDGGPAHSSMRDWINHCVQSVQGSDTLLLVKPHPHELNNQIATFPTEYFADLISEPMGKNAILLGHRWFDIADLRDVIDLGLIYNGTTAVELGIMGIPCLLAGHFAPIDYPIGHAVPRDRADFAAMLRGEVPVNAAADLALRAALWLDYMAGDVFTLPYGYHARPVTNTVLYPPWWIASDLERYRDEGGDRMVTELAARGLGLHPEPV